MDQPTADHALRRFDPLVGEWTLEASPPGGQVRLTVARIP